MLFEKRLIEKAIKDQGKCPVTGENLVVEDLLVVQGTKQCVMLSTYGCHREINAARFHLFTANKALRPRPISGTSIPGLLVAFQVITN